MVYISYINFGRYSIFFLSQFLYIQSNLLFKVLLYILKLCPFIPPIIFKYPLMPEQKVCDTRQSAMPSDMCQHEFSRGHSKVWLPLFSAGDRNISQIPCHIFFYTTRLTNVLCLQVHSYRCFQSSSFYHNCYDKHLYQSGSKNSIFHSKINRKKCSWLMQPGYQAVSGIDCSCLIRYN